MDSIESIAQFLSQSACWYMIVTDTVFDDVISNGLAKEISALLQSGVYETVDVAVTRLVSDDTVPRLPFNHFLSDLNDGWVLEPVKRRNLQLGAFRFEANEATPPTTAVCLVVIETLKAASKQTSPPDSSGSSGSSGSSSGSGSGSSPFVLNEAGFSKLVRLFPRIASIGSMVVQLHSERKTVCDRAYDLARQQHELYRLILDSAPAPAQAQAASGEMPRLAGGMSSFSVPSSSQPAAKQPQPQRQQQRPESTLLRMPIWNNQSLAARQSRVGGGRVTMYSSDAIISLAALCGSQSLAVPYLHWTASNEQVEMMADESVRLIGRGVPTEQLRETPLFASKTQLTSTGGCISFGPLGVMPAYIGFTAGADASARSVFGHIHSNRFALRTDAKLGEREAFDTAGQTITPCRVDVETVRGWAKRLPESSGLVRFEAAFGGSKVGMEHALASASAPRAPRIRPSSVATQPPEQPMDRIPNLPFGMYGPRFDVTDAALVEAIHWWVVYAKAAHGVGGERQQHITGAMMADGSVLLTLPILPTGRSLGLPADHPAAAVNGGGIVLLTPSPSTNGVTARVVARSNDEAGATFTLLERSAERSAERSESERVRDRAVIAAVSALIALSCDRTPASSDSAFDDDAKNEGLDEMSVERLIETIVIYCHAMPVRLIDSWMRQLYMTTIRQVVDRLLLLTGLTALCDRWHHCFYQHRPISEFFAIAPAALAAPTAAAAPAPAPAPARKRLVVQRASKA